MELPVPNCIIRMSVSKDDKSKRKVFISVEKIISNITQSCFVCEVWMWIEKNSVVASVKRRQVRLGSRHPIGINCECVFAILGHNAGQCKCGGIEFGKPSRSQNLGLRPK